ncbi:DUF72 domain-containing protein [Candidatus Parcubacteria bacterium]|nr:MAG: DUF72 domain-containing protein [Candidatus Parcubacteria bacterium]
MVRRAAYIFIGTSGWMYKDWGKQFYPKKLPPQERLRYLAGVFNTVEVNNSFYRLPKPETFKKWRSETPDDFRFSVKLSRYITHIRRLQNTEDSFGLFLENAAQLKKKLGPILIQMPPQSKPDFSRLEEFLKEASRETKGFRHALPHCRLALEVRHRGWFAEPEFSRLVKLLKCHNVALVFAHSARHPYPESEPITADFVYLRFHGPKEFAASRYGGARLRSYAAKITAWVRQGRTVYAYFNNDVHGYALNDAFALKRRVRVV